MSKDISLDLNTLKPKLKKVWKKVSVHLPFAAILLALFVYLLVVWNIRSLATAEPSPEDQDAATLTAKIPKIDQKAINQIQALENNSPAVHSLFNEARTNPFNE